MRWRWRTGLKQDLTKITWTMNMDTILRLIGEKGLTEGSCWKYSAGNTSLDAAFPASGTREDWRELCLVSGTTGQDLNIVLLQIKFNEWRWASQQSQISSLSLKEPPGARRRWNLWKSHKWVLRMILLVRGPQENRITNWKSCCYREDCGGPGQVSRGGSNSERDLL